MKEVEVEMGGFRSDIEEHIARLSEEMSITKSQMKA